jgi:multiple sugar transport system ATP-binding protein
MADIVLTSLSKSYLVKRGDKVEALSDISLEIPDHSFFTILGESGSGKTTLLKVIAGLENYDEGTIHFNGVEASHLSLKEKNMAMVSQNLVLYPHSSIYENVMLGLYPLHLSEQEMKERILEVAHLCQMEPYLTRRPAQLSGGQKQRAVLMRALARKADLVLMDEPLSNIETPFREELIQNLLRVKSECHSTFLYATHNLDEAMRLSDRIALLSEGRLLQCAEPQAFYQTPKSLQVFRFMNPGEALVIPRQPTMDLPPEVAQIGLTSSDIQLKKDGGKLQAKIKAVRFDENGEYRLQLLFESGQEIAVSVPQNNWEIGEVVGLDWDKAKEIDFSINGLNVGQGK